MLDSFQGRTNARPAPSLIGWLYNTVLHLTGIVVNSPICCIVFCFLKLQYELSNVIFYFYHLKHGFAIANLLLGEAFIRLSSWCTFSSEGEKPD